MRRKVDRRAGGWSQYIRKLRSLGPVLRGFPVARPEDKRATAEDALNSPSQEEATGGLTPDADMPNGKPSGGAEYGEDQHDEDEEKTAEEDPCKSGSI